MNKVLHVVSSLGRGSGVMSFIMNYYRNINTKKISFDFLYFYDVEQSYLDEIVKMGGNVYKIGYPKNIFSFLKKISLFFSNRKNEYIAIHCHPIYSFFFISIMAQKAGIHNIIQHSHTTKYSNKFLSSIRNRFIMMFSKKLITVCAACSKDALCVFPKINLKNKSVIIINNAIDIDKYSYNPKYKEKIRNEFNISENSVVIGNISRFSSEKNHDILIDIFYKFHKKYNNSKLLLIGDGYLKDNIKNKVIYLGLEECVIFAGIRSNTNEILSAMDVFVLPSSFEGFGIVAIESQANGLLTICSKGVPDSVIITDKAVKMDVYGDDNIKNIVNYMIENINYNRKVDMGVLKKTNYNIKNECKKLEDFYLSLVGAPNEKK